MEKLILGTPIERFTRTMFTQIIRKLAAFLAEGDFSISEIAALHVVQKQGGMPIQALGKELNLSISATSRLVTGLVKKGYFLRRPDPEDKRTKIVSCSKAGERLLDDMSLARVGAVYEIIPTLPAEIPRQIMAAVSKFTKEE